MGNTQSSEIQSGTVPESVSIVLAINTFSQSHFGCRYSSSSHLIQVSHIILTDDILDVNINSINFFRFLIFYIHENYLITNRVRKDGVFQNH